VTAPRLDWRPNAVDGRDQNTDAHADAASSPGRVRRLSAGEIFGDNLPDVTFTARSGSGSLVRRRASEDIG